MEEILVYFYNPYNIYWTEVNLDQDGVARSRFTFCSLQRMHLNLTGCNSPRNMFWHLMRCSRGYITHSSHVLKHAIIFCLKFSAVSLPSIAMYVSLKLLKISGSADSKLKEIRVTSHHQNHMTVIILITVHSIGLLPNAWRNG